MNVHRFFLTGGSLLALVAILASTSGLVSADTSSASGDNQVNPLAYLQPGEHTIPFPPSATRRVRFAYEHKFTWNPIQGAISCPYLAETGADVGFVHAQDNIGGNSCTEGTIYQQAVAFDFSQLRQVNLLVLGARLQYDEAVVDSRSTDGEPVGAADCAERFARPTVNWNNWNGLIPNEDESYAGTRGDWNVTHLVQQLIGFPAEDHGILLRGTVEGQDDDSAACLSRLSNVRLVLHYIIGS